MRYNDFSIRTKMLLGFFVVILLTVVLAVVSYINLSDIDGKYTITIDGTIARRSNVSQILSDYLRIRRAGVQMILFSDDPNTVTSMEKEIEDSFTSINDSYTTFVNALPTDFLITDAERQSQQSQIDNIHNLINEQYRPVIDTVISSCKAGNPDAAIAVLTKAAEYATQIDTATTSLREELLAKSAEVNNSNTDSANASKLLVVVMAVLTFIASLLIATIQSGSIKKGVGKVAHAANEISKGNLNVEVGSNDKDELGALSNSLLEVKTAVNNLVRETREVSTAMSEGDIKKRIELSSYSGEYRAFAETINNTFDGVVAEVLYAIEIISNFGNGNFDFTVKTFPGDKIVLTNSAVNVQKNLKNISGEIGNIIQSAIKGELDVRIDSSKYKGDWASLTGSINDLLGAIVVPINEAISALGQLSNGNLSASVTGNYQGEFAKMKDALNNTISMLKIYISEISSVLGKMSDEDLTASITREYVGDFNEIKSSINMILTTFNKLITDINNSAAQVASGAQQISEASMNLAQGSTEQASSIEELNATVDDVAAKTSKNASSADHANNLALQTRQHAQEGNKEMKNMLDSMHQINESSRNISNIIKVIEDIAFQTNLLALNAAVEAARAGQYGKGFAVVAEEVRSLAARSQKAVKDTSELIQGSVEKVSEGSTIADKTAEALNAIVLEIDEISTIINEVAESSLQQSEAISQINVGITQIANVTQANSATSEEQASSAEELSSQATLFKAMVNQFKLRNTY